ncbi:hypothetical protein K466DRAFT_484717 [Polyporus arcularius HHB13444]|uniref:DUF6589 domain-containing protein n=1 Tax=Polyporus arcularius HHB13444 TaxID=1314778 RepID=A0A5C3PN03_9APHY|nr:hypothetical protein K466DRAFT_484717 [Polyporus arcularius HHB13444]
MDACQECGHSSVHGDGVAGSTGDATADSVLRILDAISKERMTVGRFLKALSWGNATCVSNGRIRNTRTAFMNSPELPRLLETWWKPPRSPNSHKSRSDAGRSVLESFAVRAVHETLQKELDLVDPLLRASEDRLTKDELTQLNLDELETDIRTRAPMLWGLFEYLCKTVHQHKENVEKNSSKRILGIVATLGYSRSRLCNRLQRMLAIYFKFKGLTAKGCDTLHALGLTMSSKWTTQSVEKMSAEAMAEVQGLIKICASFLSYDNVYMTFRIFSQRLDKVREQAAGTAATVYIKRDAPRLSSAVAHALQTQRCAGMKNPIGPLDIVNLAKASEPAINRAKSFHILQVLVDAPEFDLSTYQFRNSHLLEPPPPVSELPCGPDHVTLQYMLGSLPIPEATYADNDKVVSALLSQMGYTSLEARHIMSTEFIQFIVGDQLTVERLRGLQLLLCQEWNAYERLEFIVPVFGWLHFQMALAKSIHKQYFGTDAGKGLKHAFTILCRKGLDRRVTQGPFHDNLEHALYDILEAHLRDCWIKATGVSDLKELRDRSPEELTAFADQILREYASSSAMVDLRDTLNPPDELRIQSTMFLRDVLLYVVLDRAIKYGDIGMMEGILPHTLFRFAGGKNNNYTTECLELLQGLHREWPPEVCDYVRQHCWLVNSTGKRDGHTPVDRVQEKRIKDIKVTHRSQGPSVDWDYLKKLHPAVPVIQHVADHIEDIFRTWTRYSRHTRPRDIEGIRLLQRTYSAAKVHVTDRRGRTSGSEADGTTDLFNRGCLNIGKTMQRWVHARTFPRATRDNRTPVAEDLSILREAMDMEVDADSSGSDDA